MTTRVGFRIEQVQPADGGYVAGGHFFSNPILLTMMRCERHNDASLDDDVLEGLSYYGLRKMVDGAFIGYAAGETHLISGAQRFDVRLYRLVERITGQNER